MQKTTKRRKPKNEEIYPAAHPGDSLEGKTHLHPHIKQQIE